VDYRSCTLGGREASEAIAAVFTGSAQRPAHVAPVERVRRRRAPVTAVHARGRDPSNANWIDTHADGLVSILLPGLGLRIAARRTHESGLSPPRMCVLLALVPMAEAGFVAV
jgi:hypothetical protein